MKLAVLVCFAFISALNAKIIPTLYNSISEFKSDNPNATVIEMLSYDHELDGSRSYSIGHRQTGDLVVSNVSNKNVWKVPQNLTTTLTYPSSGTNGAYLTFIIINCEQSSNLGQAYVTYGGVNQHFIQIIVEAKVTTYFNYAGFFYGIK